MAGPGSHHFDEKDAAHRGTGGLERFDGLVGQRDGRMKAQRRRSGDVIVDCARYPDDLHAKIFKDGTSASETSIASQDDQCTVFQVWLQIANGGLLNPLILKILKAAATDRATGLAHHTACIAFLDFVD